MTAPKKYISAGTQLAFYGIYNSSGVHLGGAASLAQGAAGNGMKRLVGIKTANPGPAEPESETITGDDDVLGVIEFPPNTLPEWIVTSGAFDLDIQAAFQTTLVETLGEIQIGVIQPRDAVYPDIFWIYNAKSKSKDAGLDGAKAWSGYFIPRSSVVPLGRENFEERAAAVDRYSVVAQMADKKAWGVTIAVADLGTTAAPLLPFTSDNPLTLHVFEGDGSIAEFGPLDFTPVSVDKIYIFEGNGQLLTATVDFTVDTATKFITRTAGNLAENVKWQVLYEIAQ